MAEYMPQLAPIVVLLFLGSAMLIGISVLVLFCGAVCRSSLLAKLGGGTALTVAAGYFLLLGGVSLASSEKVLAPGGLKYFCEIDCHLAYSVEGVQTAAALGPELQQIIAHGKFIVVRVKTWFDERTISARRDNSPLTPNRRKVFLVDDAGRSFAVSLDGQSKLNSSGSNSTPLSHPLRPGESYTTDLVFDVPSDARGLRLLIAEDDPETRLLIGHENSLLHKKIFLDVQAAPRLVGLLR